MIKTNNDSNNINPIFYAKKEGGYIIFLSQGGDEICRCVDASEDASLPYKLNLTDTGRINLKDSSGNILSYVQQLSTSEQTAVREMIENPPSSEPQRLIHCGMYPFRYDGTKWVTGNDTYKYNLFDGGLNLSLKTSGITDATTIPLDLSSRPSVGHFEANKIYHFRLSLLDCENGGGGSAGGTGYGKTSFATASYDFFIKFTQGHLGGPSITLQGITETQRGWSAIGVLLEAWGDELTPYT